MNAWHVTSCGNGITELSFDLPGEKVNKLTASAMQELDTILQALAADRDIRCLAIRSKKPGIFIAGADITEIAGLTDPLEAEHKAHDGQKVLNRLEDLPFPTVAIIDID